MDVDGAAPELHHPVFNHVQFHSICLTHDITVQDLTIKLTPHFF